MKQSKKALSDASKLAINGSDFSFDCKINQRAFSPLIVSNKFHSKDYIGEMIASNQSMDDRSQSAVAPLLTDFIVILEPLITNQSKEMKGSDGNDND